MNRDYLGDSYDAVKRLWQQILQPWAPLYAEPRFIPMDLRAEFSHFTGIPLLVEPLPSKYSIFNDPNTGVRLPDRANQSESRSHIALPAILNQLHNAAVRCVITFDQSHHRLVGMSSEAQREAKTQWLANNGVHAFYYVSHAPFLFAFPTSVAKHETHTLLLQAGIPAKRIQCVTTDA